MVYVLFRRPTHAVDEFVSSVDASRASDAAASSSARSFVF